jgi:predicted transcriptional regulator
MNKNNPTSIRFSNTAKNLLDKLSEKLDISKPAILELAIRHYAKSNEVEEDNNAEKTRN